MPDDNPMDFSFSMKGVDTAFPSLSVGEHRVAFNGFKVKPTKNPGEHQFRVEVSVQEPFIDTKGKLQKEGFKSGFNLTTPVGGDNDEIRIKMMARFLDALGGFDENSRPDFCTATLNGFIGKNFIVVVKKSKDDTYGETEIKDFKFIPVAA